MKEIDFERNLNAVVVFVPDIVKYMRIEPRGRMKRFQNPTLMTQ
jgi:hypothetical protein